jgi:two-component system response regulator PilR (NtrC family)
MAWHTPALPAAVVPAGPAELPVLPAVPAELPVLPAVPASLPADLEAYLDGVERDILVRALERHRNNRTAAGASLGLSLRQMRYRMARLQVGVGTDAAVESDAVREPGGASDRLS